MRRLDPRTTADNAMMAHWPAANHQRWKDRVAAEYAAQQSITGPTGDKCVALTNEDGEHGLVTQASYQAKTESGCRVHGLKLKQPRTQRVGRS